MLKRRKGRIKKKKKKSDGAKRIYIIFREIAAESSGIDRTELHSIFWIENLKNCFKSLTEN